ncbi:hypothetical protein LCGC14_2905260 [marine sediment metagenome]|uniref:Uncharacterized protein n=1 Tax=marine sediment metagenome TaxID=412755 RepID=A0A0F9A105_9ZZZZ
MHIIALLAWAYVLYIFCGLLYMFIVWICTNWYRFGTAVVIIGSLVAYIESRPADPPYEFSYPVYEEESKPTEPVYVTQILGRDSTGTPIEKGITLDQCKALPGYRSVVYGICYTYVP